MSVTASSGCRNCPPLGCVVEARGRRYQRHEWTEDRAELLDFVKWDDGEYYRRQQWDDHACQQRDKEVRECAASLVF